VVQQQRGAMRANKTGPASDQNRLSHRSPSVFATPGKREYLGKGSNVLAENSDNRNRQRL
jgi:hypothetical protein